METARLGERLQDEHGVRDRHVFEVLGARLEGLQHGFDRFDVPDRVGAGSDRRDRVADGAREVVAPLPWR